MNVGLDGDSAIEVEASSALAGNTSCGTIDPVSLDR
jgi:hypothetical protein